MTHFLLIWASSILIIVFCNYINQYNKKFWCKNFQIELFLCLLPIICVILAGYKLFDMYIGYMDGEYDD